jgi:fumarate reductase flavoprotein subunit
MKRNRSEQKDEVAGERCPETRGTAITRRQFVTGTGLAGAALLAGIGAPAKSNAAAAPQKWDKETDVIVVGYGAAGGTAAIEAHDAGAKVLLLDKMPAAGGNTAISGGILYGANTSVQRGVGVFDSAEEMYKYYMAVGENMLDPARVKFASENYGKTIEWLIALGVDIPHKLGRPGLYVSGAEQKFTHITPAKPRGHEVTGAGGGLFTAVRKAVDTRKIETLLRTEAKELIISGEREVIGLIAESRGKRMSIKARKGVILTSGGFSYSKEMRRNYRPDLMEAVSYCAPGLTGDGIRLALALGADLENMGNAYRVNVVAKVSPERGALVLPLLEHPCIMINKKGKRFVSEGEFYEYIVSELIKQEGRLAYIIFDENVKTKGGKELAYGFSKDLGPEMEAGVVRKAGTIRELAGLMGVDPRVLDETVAKVNDGVKAGKDPEFGRKKGFGAVATPPFYFLEARVGLSDTVGGLKTDLDARVIDVFGKPIPRLYAAGTVADGWMFKVYPGSGTYLGNAFCFGRIAGKKAAAEKPV